MEGRNRNGKWYSRGGMQLEVSVEELGSWQGSLCHMAWSASAFFSFWRGRVLEELTPLWTKPLKGLSSRVWRSTCPTGNHDLSVAFSAVCTLCAQATEHCQPIKWCWGFRANGLWEEEGLNWNVLSEQNHHRWHWDTKAAQRASWRNPEISKALSEKGCVSDFLQTAT